MRSRLGERSAARTENDSSASGGPSAGVGRGTAWLSGLCDTWVLAGGSTPERRKGVQHATLRTSGRDDRDLDPGTQPTDAAAGTVPSAQIPPYTDSKSHPSDRVTVANTSHVPTMFPCVSGARCARPGCQARSGGWCADD
ncbi:hypothetical protein GCM10027067_19570 [Pseudactinotalea suaedae]